MLVFVSEPTFPGCLVTARPIGVFWMSDEHGPDAKLLCVPDRDPRFADIVDIGDLDQHLLKEIWHFFDVYKTLEPGKSTSTRGWGGVDEARQALQEAIDRYQPQGSQYPTQQASGRLLSTGGLPSAAHPVRRGRRSTASPAPFQRSPARARW